MKNNFRNGFLSIAFLFIVSGQCQADLWIGGGLSGAKYDLNHESFHGQSGSGVNLSMENYFADDWAFDMSLSAMGINVGTTTDIYYPPDTASAGLIYLGIKKDFVLSNDGNFRFWAGGGYGIPLIMWDSYWYNVSGSGFAYSAGISRKLAPDFRLNGGYRNYLFKGYSSGDTPVDGGISEWFLALQYNISH